MAAATTPRLNLSELILGRPRIPVITHAPANVRWIAVRARCDWSVRATLATRDGRLRTAHGKLSYRAGQHYIIQAEHGGFAVVKRSIFEKTYAPEGGDRFIKRTDVPYRYFTLPHPAFVATLEGPQRAAKGDWIMQGVEGELWPMTRSSARKRYVPIEEGADGKDPRDNSFGQLADTIGRLARKPGDDPNLQLGEILNAAGRRTYGSLLLMLGLFSISPATLIPGMTWLTAAVTLLLALQLTFGSARPWLPRQFLGARVSKDAVLANMGRLRGLAKWADRLFSVRLSFLTAPPYANIAGVFVVLAALLTFPLGLIPMAPLVTGVAITAIGLGLFARDGALLLIGCAAVGAALSFAYVAIA